MARGVPTRRIPTEFVDRHEAARILGLSHPESYSRYPERYAATLPFPPVVRRVANSEVRRRSQLEVWASRAAGVEPAKRLVRRAEVDVEWPAWALDRDEVAAALAVRPATVSRYAADPEQGFPRPVASFSSHPVWDAAQIEEWDAARPGHGGAVRGARAKAECAGCATPRVLRRDGTVIAHTVAPSKGGGLCRGSGRAPGSLAA